jgi:ubiquinone/menaquinone biosynthesis C-methylase UbiE
LAPQRLLETAAGTGIVTRAMARALAEPVSITATDLNQAMVDYAAAQTTAPNVTWRQADALALPFDDGTFDAVVCQFGAMFFPDKRAGYREALRVLKPGGRFLFNVWDRIQDNEISHVLTEAVAALFPADPPRFLARTPHGYHDVRVIRDELEQAGFARVEIETVEKRGRSPSPRDPAIGFCQGSPLRSEIEARDAGRLQEATAAAADALAARFGAGPIEGKIQAHVITAVK